MSRDLYYRQMCRCSACGRWWSVGPNGHGDPLDVVDSEARCPCGGTVAPVDAEAHAKTLPYTPTTTVKPLPKPDKPKPP